MEEEEEGTTSDNKMKLSFPKGGEFPMKEMKDICYCKLKWKHLRVRETLRMY